jgi:hypothetical protein
MVLNVGRACYSLKTLYTLHNSKVKCSTFAQLCEPLEHVGLCHGAQVEYLESVWNI